MFVCFFVNTYRIMLTVVFVLFSAEGNVSGIGLWFSGFFCQDVPDYVDCCVCPASVP